MSVHKVTDYKDKDGKWRWNVAVTPGTPASTPDDIIADSGQGYENRKDMLNSFFGIFFGSYDDSFLALYNEWNPSDNGGGGVPSDTVVVDVDEDDMEVGYAVDPAQHN